MKDNIKWWIFTGPESSGKSTLAAKMAEETGIYMIEEQVRLLMEGGHFPEIGETQVMQLADLQYAAEILAASRHGLPLILDTDMLSYIIWFEWTFGPAPRHWRERLTRRSNVHYFLCRPDIPWVADTLREHPHVRNDLFLAHEKCMTELGLPFTVIEGHGHLRWETVYETFAKNSFTD